MVVEEVEAVVEVLLVDHHPVHLEVLEDHHPVEVHAVHHHFHRKKLRHHVPNKIRPVEVQQEVDYSLLLDVVKC